MKFAMLICGDDSEWSNLPPDAEQDVMKEIYQWYERWQPTGKIADGGAVVTDGPYLELKEVIGGFVLLETDTIEEAVEVASTWPRSAGMTSIEVRPVMTRE